jgi:hypothetical protein
MNLKDILAISGEGTLFKFIAQGKNAVIVENLETGRRFSAGAQARVSALDEISIFTTGEDMPLGKVMDLLWEKENGGEVISHRLPENELKEYFAAVLPDYDPERVYTSDIKKVLNWYNILHRLGMLVREEESTADEVETVAADEERKAGEKSSEGKKAGRKKSDDKAEAGKAEGKGGAADKQSAPDAEKPSDDITAEPGKEV